MKDFLDKNINVIALTLLAMFFGVLALKIPGLGKDAVTAVVGALSAIMVQQRTGGGPPAPTGQA